MDSLTQIVLGAAVGEVVLGKKVGNKAMLWGAIAGTIPDLDVYQSLFFDSLRANELHRGFSHSQNNCHTKRLDQAHVLGFDYSPSFRLPYHVGNTIAVAVTSKISLE